MRGAAEPSRPGLVVQAEMIKELRDALQVSNEERARAQQQLEQERAALQTHRSPRSPTREPHHDHVAATGRIQNPPPDTDELSTSQAWRAWPMKPAAGADSLMNVPANTAIPEHSLSSRSKLVGGPPDAQAPLNSSARFGTTWCASSALGGGRGRDHDAGPPSPLPSPEPLEQSLASDSRAVPLTSTSAGGGAVGSPSDASRLAEVSLSGESMFVFLDQARRGAAAAAAAGDNRRPTDPRRSLVLASMPSVSQRFPVGDTLFEADDEDDELGATGGTDGVRRSHASGLSSVSSASNAAEVADRRPAASPLQDTLDRTTGSLGRQVDRQRLSEGTAGGRKSPKAAGGVDGKWCAPALPQVLCR